MSLEPTRKRVLSGVQPTGKLHIGNYIGALTQWRELQDEFENFYCVVDLHALTIPDVVRPEELRAKTREIAAIYIASGIDPRKSAIFIQSMVTEHAYLSWILTCATPLGWLERMTQFKDKAQKQESVGAGLLCYPALMAADILLYDAALVPVGNDQKQHLEYTRDLAIRFNAMFGETFVVPEAMIRTAGARIMGLDDPTAKMSKSAGEERDGHSIGILDPPAKLKKAIMSAKTDSGQEVRFDHAGPGVKNLLTIYQVLSGESQPAIEARFGGQGYGFLKKSVLEVVVETLRPIQARVHELLDQPDELDAILINGAERARAIAGATMARVADRLGIAADRNLP